jgi:hypothetical protein
MRNRNLLVILILISFQAKSQQNFKISLGMRADNYPVYKHIISNDSLIIKGIFPENPRLHIGVLWSSSLSGKFSFETGVRYFAMYHAYSIAGFHSGFGDFVSKVGGVKSNTINTSVSLGYAVLNRLTLKAFLSASFCIIEKGADREFQDVPKVNDFYNSVKHTFKPVYLNYGWGLGYRIWKVEVSYLFSRSFSSVSNPVPYKGGNYPLYQNLTSHFIEVAYVFPTNKKDKN